MTSTLNQQLEIVKFSEEGMLKVEIGQKLSFSYQKASSVMNAKKVF